MRVEIKGINKRLGGQEVVRGLDLEVADGELLVILGPSGCGKTTTLRMIAGLESPDGGQIVIGDRVVADPSAKVLVSPQKRNLGMVFQSYAVWPHMTVYKNVEYPLRVRGVNRADRREAVARALDLVGLSDQASKRATAVSGGQAQRIALARALVYDPAVLLLDEPLSNLDLKMRERLRTELKSIQRKSGVTSVYVTHDQTEAMELGDRIAVMREGRLEQWGTPESLWREPSSRFVADFFGSANVVECVARETVEDRFILQAPDGQEIEAARAGQDLSPGESVYVVLRQAELELVSDRPDGNAANYWPVEVLDNRLQGSTREYVVKWGGESIRVSTSVMNDTFPPGSRKHLHIPSDRVAITRR